MKSSKIMFFTCWLGIMVLLAPVPTVAESNATTKEERLATRTDEPSEHAGTISRLLADRPRPPAKMTCDRYPTVCRAKGSAGPDCCNRQCVNVMTDKENCGKCGKKCSYTDICCQGRCVNPNADNYHCGRCNNACKKGSSCVYGLCNYAG